MLKVLLDVSWSDGRVVRVSLRGLPLVRSGAGDGLGDRRGARPFNPEDAASMSALHKFLASVTRSAPDGAVVEAVGFEPDVDALLDLLEIEGPPPDVIAIKLPTS
jgi:hypothetical protein